MTNTETTQTTFEKFAGAKRGNYCTLPTIDVLILDEPRQCGRCDSTVTYQPHPKGIGWGLGTWVHEDGTESDHYVTPALQCRYCGTQDPAQVTFVQASWSDETRCTRCGGVDGRAIGD